MGVPLYLTVKEAAKYVGIGERAMWDFIHSTDPPPYLMNGKKYLLQTAALPGYFERKQEVKQ